MKRKGWYVEEKQDSAQLKKIQDSLNLIKEKKLKEAALKKDTVKSDTKTPTKTKKK